MKQLTLKQASILEHIKKMHEETGIMPTIRELAVDFDMSIKGAYDHLQALVKKGFVKVFSGLARGIQVTGKTTEYNVDDLLKYQVKQQDARYLSRHKKRVKCIICGSKENLHNHHEDYDNPELIITFCCKHHSEWHKYKNRLSSAGYQITLLITNTL